MQLRCCGLAEYKSLMEQGYPIRIEYDQFLDVYGLSPICHRFKQLRVEVLLRIMGLKQNEFKLGNTRVCFRPLNSHILANILHPDENETEQVRSAYEKKLNIFRRWSTVVSKLLKNQLATVEAQ